MLTKIQLRRKLTAQLLSNGYDKATAQRIVREFIREWEK